MINPIKDDVLESFLQLVEEGYSHFRKLALSFLQVLYYNNYNSNRHLNHLLHLIVIQFQIILIQLNISHINHLPYE